MQQKALELGAPWTGDAVATLGRLSAQRELPQRGGP